MKNTAQLSCRSQLVLTPSLRQAISLLALSYTELLDVVYQEAAHNPLLTVNHRSGPAHFDSQLNQIADQHQYTMASYLEQTLFETSLEPRVKNIFSQLITGIDEFGFLPLRYRQQLSPDLQQQYLNWAHQLEPLGLGAADLCESLVWQLRKLPFSQPQQALLEFIMLVKKNQLTWHEKKDFFKKFQKNDPDMMTKVDKIFQNLQLYPARAFMCQTFPDIQAELILVQENGVFKAQLNDELLCHIDLLPPSNKKQEVWYLQGQGFKKMLATRYQTLLKVAQFLVESQQDFFKYDHNPAALKPLQLRELGTALALHESTISRIAQSKYLWTPQGFVPLKLLFARKIYHQEYGAVSSNHVQHCLHSLLAHEDKNDPLSDRQLQEILEKQGYQLARRTIAKYREALGIPNSRKRKI